MIDTDIRKTKHEVNSMENQNCNNVTENSKDSLQHLFSKKEHKIGLQMAVVLLLLSFSISGCGTKAEKTSDTEKVTDNSEATQREDTKAADETGKETPEVADAPTIVMETPPFTYFLSDKVTPDTTSDSAIRLFKEVEKSNGITDEADWFTQNALSLNKLDLETITNNSDPAYSEIKATWNNLKITAAFQDEKYIYTTYGVDYSQGYYLKIYDAVTKENLYTLDFSNYKEAPDFQKDYEGYVQQQITWATIQDNVLYISNSHNTYADFSMGQNAYITAIDLSDLSILWRSDPLVCNTRNFIILENTIVCGYGFTAEDDYLYELSKNTGKVLETIPLASGPSYIIEADGKIYVRTYNTDYVFNILTQ